MSVFFPRQVHSTASLEGEAKPGRPQQPELLPPGVQEGSLHQRLGHPQQEPRPYRRLLTLKAQQHQPRSKASWELKSSGGDVLSAITLTSRSSSSSSSALGLFSFDQYFFLFCFVCKKKEKLNGDTQANWFGK